MRRCVSRVVIFFVASVSPWLPAVPALGQGGQRGIDVADSIRFRSLGDPWYVINGGSLGRAASFSPDGKYVAVVLRHGEPESNSNVYELLVYRSADLEQGRSRWFRRLEYRSSSNRPAIYSLRWAQKAASLYFIGEDTGDLGQLRRLDLGKGTVATLTHSPTAVRSYSITADERTVAFVAEASWRSLWSDEDRRKGLTLSDQQLQDLMTGRAGHRFRGIHDEFDLYVQERGRLRLVDLPRHISRNAEPALSPDGRRLIVQTRLRRQDVPPSWLRSENRWFVRTVAVDAREITPESYFAVYDLVETATGQARMLVETPTFSLGQPVWINGGKSVVVDLQMTGGAAEAMGGTREVGLVEVDVDKGTTRPLPSVCSTALSWVQATQTLTCNQEPAPTDRDLKYVTLRRSGEIWNEIGTPRMQSPLTIFLEEAPVARLG